MHMLLWALDPFVHIQQPTAGFLDLEGFCIKSYTHVVMPSTI